MENTKTCTRCKKVKSCSDFRKRTGNKTNKDGLNATCRRCDLELTKIYNQKKKDANPLILCSICNTLKHYLLFYSTRKSHNNGIHKCIECILLKEAGIKIDNRKVEYNEIGQRKCSKCKQFKYISCFNKSSSNNTKRDKYRSHCKECDKEERQEHEERNKKAQQKWNKENKQYMLEYQSNYCKNRRKNDVAYRLQKNIHCAILSSIKKYSFNNTKIKRLLAAILKRLPYSIDELITHIESQWELWMDWDNHGKYDPQRMTWQIDHIIPQSKLRFNDLDDNNFQKLWALSNMRPLETIANIKKGNK